MQRTKMTINERAKIFAPFDALKGFRELLKEQEFIKEDKKELSEDMIENLSNIINLLKNGMIIELIHYNYNENSYQKTIGVVSKIDKNNHLLTVVKTKINFDNIYSINILEEEI